MNSGRTVTALSMRKCLRLRQAEQLPAVSIGHAGENLMSVGYELHSTATKMLNGELRDEKTLALIFSAEGYDWKTDDAILAAIQMSAL